ncbi:hypothetical protein MLD38_023080 [Melastoma candidum]|uniref:Uncharacterized protein n=1 Tax=Melastoma candidum TaxID=119954 RepID=A0ACB9QLB4_9MYRT|nr:hypothetical protein MLD38_023080 [Melastoma candidum]
MSSSQSLGGQTPVGRVLGPSLDQIIKNASWRKHSNIVSAAKSALDLLHSLAPSSSSTAAAPLVGISFADSVVVLSPILLSLLSSQPKLIPPRPPRHLPSVLTQPRPHLPLPTLIPLIPPPAAGSSPSSPSQLISRLIQAVCDSCSVADDAAELAVLRVLLSAVRSPCLFIRGELLEFADKNLNEGSSIQFCQGFLKRGCGW